MKICCFGDIRSHTHAAAVALYENDGVSDGDITGCDTVYECLRKVHDGECDVAVVPIENSFEGTVAATEDGISELRLYIVRETVQKIEQKLIVQQGVKQEDIRTVYSHPQALAQCRHALREKLPQAKTVSVAYTSAALDMLDMHSAAIAREPKAGQTVLYPNFEDSSENCTRFVAVQASPKREGNKVSVLFATRNEPGRLLRVLRVFEENGYNMTKIESRPAKRRMGQYVFYVDFLFDGNEQQWNALMVQLSDKAEDLQFLGRYPAHTNK